MPVAPNRNRNLQSRQLQLPIKLRERHTHRVLQPPRATQRRRPCKHHQDHNNAQKYAQNRPPAPLVLDLDTPPQNHLGVIVSSHVLLNLISATLGMLTRVLWPRATPYTLFPTP